jgi:hypothetical protein
MCGHDALTVVVAAKAGTHTHRRFDLAMTARPVIKTNAGGYGSALSRGRGFFIAALALFCTPALAGDDALVTYKSLSPEVAFEAAQAVLKSAETAAFRSSS